MNRLPHSITRTLQAGAAPVATARSPVRLGLGTPAALGMCVLGLIAAATLALSVNSYYVFVLAGIALVAIVGIGLNVLIGLTGQVSFGHVGFYAVGAYTVAILTSRAGLSFWLAWPLAAVVAGALGVLLALPALRVKGPYLAMITIAFSFIIQHAIIEWRDVTGGQNGIMGLVAPSVAGLQGERAIAILALASVAVVLAGYCWLVRGSWGAAMRAVRDSETAAESIGGQDRGLRRLGRAGGAGRWFVRAAVRDGDAGLLQLHAIHPLRLGGGAGRLRFHHGAADRRRHRGRLAGAAGQPGRLSPAVLRCLAPAGAVDRTGWRDRLVVALGSTLAQAGGGAGVDDNAGPSHG
jgi:hypothetical protein